MREASAIISRAVFLGHRIDTRTLSAAKSTYPLVIERDNGYLILFRYGVVVLFGLAPKEQRQILDLLAPLVTEPYFAPEEEDIEIRVAPGTNEGVSSDEAIVVRELNTDRLLVIAAILAKSVALAQYEKEVAQVFGSIEPLAAELRRTGRSRRPANALIRHVGDTLRIQHQMVGRIEVLEKPEFLWEHPEHERLYKRLAAQYELRERHLALERKLELVNNTVDTVLELLRSKRSLRVEWYIVILILVEIGLTLYKMFVGD